MTERETAMGPSEQMSPSALQDLLYGGGLAGEWLLDSSRSAVWLRSRSIWGLVPVNGSFRQVAGQGTVSQAGEVSGSVTVAAASIDTKNVKRDRHLRSADFFDCARYPDIIFAVEGMRPSGQGVTTTGTLTVRGRSRRLSFGSTAAVGEDGEVWLDAEVPVSQADFGLTWNRLGMVSMSNVLTIHAVFSRQ